MTPLITIAIPTRNRQVCAATLVRAALDLLPDCQVVVNDNSDDDSLRTLLADSMSDSRLSYRYQSGTLSVVENFNNALARSTGEYITFLGDDDMIGPRFLEFVVKAKAEGIDALLYRSKGRVVHYFWSGVTSPRWGDMGGKLYFSHFTGKARALNARKAARDAILHLGEGPRLMPRTYLGIVSRTLIGRVEAKYGALFGGITPDVYSSHLLAVSCVKPVVVDYPFILPGASPQSTSAAHAGRSDVGQGVTANNHLGRFVNVNWDPRIPNYYSPYTVWSQSHVKAHAKTGHPVPLRAFAYLYATCLFFTFGQSLVHLPTAIRGHIGRARKVAIALLSILFVVPVAANYVLRRIPAGVTGRPGGARFVVSGLADTRIALERLEIALGREIPEFCK
jgi:glycosyltransferase involved in cell wall biosynthesis